MNVGSFVSYTPIPGCRGIIVETGETMHKVTWIDEELITEWVPIYSLRIFEEKDNA